MGTWGTGIFENDAALDWVIELEESRGEGVLRTAFAVVDLPEGEEADGSDAECALAAAAVVAAWGGKPAVELAEEAQAWVAAQEGQPSRTLIDAAIRAVKSIMREDSELSGLWEEGGEAEAWCGECAKLLSALEAL